LEVVPTEHDGQQPRILVRVVFQLDVALEARVALELRLQSLELLDALAVGALQRLKLDGVLLVSLGELLCARLRRLRLLLLKRRLNHKDRGDEQKRHGDAGHQVGHRVSELTLVPDRLHVPTRALPFVVIFARRSTASVNAPVFSANSAPMELDTAAILSWK